ncbi:MAG: hypothetical protein Ta2E_00310 [Mycoplasmoidaceae bacterium]|nr:MAG: hypothetical protein Ta2E_00310 [Mycoplasmoidaceae bacterium]
MIESGELIRMGDVIMTVKVLEVIEEEKEKFKLISLNRRINMMVFDGIIKEWEENIKQRLQLKEFNWRWNEFRLIVWELQSWVRRKKQLLVG